MMDLMKLAKAEELFRKNEISAYDVMILSVLLTLTEYEEQTGEPISWESYLQYAKGKHLSYNLLK